VASSPLGPVVGAALACLLLVLVGGTLALGARGGARGRRWGHRPAPALPRLAALVPASLPGYHLLLGRRRGEGPLLTGEGASSQL
jgi:hypothetical protein